MSASNRTVSTATERSSARFGDDRLFDGDQAIVEGQAVFRPLLDRAREGLEDVRVDMRLQRIEIALPERFEHQPVGALRPFEETGDVKARVGGKDRSNAGPREGHVGKVAGVVRGRRGDRRRRSPRFDARILVGGLEDRLLLVAGTLAEHAVEAKPDEQSDQREDDNDRQIENPIRSCAST